MKAQSEQAKTKIPKELSHFLNWTLANEWGALALPKFHLDSGASIEILDSGVLCLTPIQPNGLDLVLSCGIHGNETAPIEIISQIITSIAQGELQPNCRVLFIIGNPAAINLSQRFVEENLNRLFSGAHSDGKGGQNKERERAKKLEQYVKEFFDQGAALTPQAERERIHYDLHTAIRDSAHEKFVIYPYQNGLPYSKKQLQLLYAMGVPTVLLHDGPATTFSYYSVTTCGAQAFTVELGKVRPFGENDLSRFRQTKQMLIELLEDRLVLPDFEPSQFVLYEVVRNILRTQEDFSLNFPDDQANFSRFKQGELLAKDGHINYFVEAEEEAIVFPNAQVALGQRAMLTVVPIEANSLNLAD